MPRGVYKRAKRKGSARRSPAHRKPAHKGVAISHHLYSAARRLRGAVKARMAAGGAFRNVELYAMLLVHELIGEDE